MLFALQWRLRPQPWDPAELPQSARLSPAPLLSVWSLPAQAWRPTKEQLSSLQKGAFDFHLSFLLLKQRLELSFLSLKLTEQSACQKSHEKGMPHWQQRTRGVSITATSAPTLI